MNRYARLYLAQNVRYEYGSECLDESDCFMKRCILFQVKLISGHRAPPAAPVASIRPATIALVVYRQADAAAVQLRQIDALNVAWSSIARIVSITK